MASSVVKSRLLKPKPVVDPNAPIDNSGDDFDPNAPVDPALPPVDAGQQPAEPVIGEPESPYANPAPAADPWRSGLAAAHFERTHQELPQERYDYFTRRKAEEKAAGYDVPDEKWFEYARGYGAGGSDVAQYGKYAGQDFDAGKQPQAPTQPWQALTPQTPSVGATNTVDPQSNVDPFAAMGGGVQINGGWVPKTNPAAAAASQAPSDVAPTSPAPTVGVPTATAQTSTAPTQDTLDDATREAILKLLNPEAVTAEGLRGTPEAAAFRLGNQRSKERQVAQVAEDASRNNYTGTGEQTAKVRGIEQQAGEGEARYIGDLATQYLERQRADIARGIEAATNAGQFKSAQALQIQLARMDEAIRVRSLDQQQSQFDASQQQQMTLATMDDAIRRAQLSQNAQQFNASLSQADRQFLAQMGLSWESLRQQARQADNNLGYNYTALQESANRAAVEAILRAGGA